jgi:hypothetical protein
VQRLKTANPSAFENQISNCGAAKAESSGTIAESESLSAALRERNRMAVEIQIAALSATRH